MTRSAARGLHHGLLVGRGRRAPAPASSRTWLGLVAHPGGGDAPARERTGSRGSAALGRAARRPRGRGTRNCRPGPCRRGKSGSVARHVRGALVGQRARPFQAHYHAAVRHTGSGSERSEIVSSGAGRAHSGFVQNGARPRPIASAGAMRCSRSKLVDGRLCRGSRRHCRRLDHETFRCGQETSGVRPRALRNERDGVLEMNPAAVGRRCPPVAYPHGVGRLIVGARERRQLKAC